MIRVINIAEYESDIFELRKAHFEVRCRENILEHLIMNGQRETEQFEKFWKEYIQYSMQCDIAKENFSNNCVYKIVGDNFKGTWRINFEKMELTIEDE